MTPSEIETVFGDDTRESQIAPAASMKGQWRQLAVWLKRPTLPGSIAPLPAAATGMMRLLALDLILISGFIAVLMAIVALGFELPNNINAQLDLNLQTVLLVVIAAPVLEELVFRSWLTGKPAILAAIAFLGAGAIAAAAIGVNTTGEEAEAGTALAFLGGLALAIIAAIVLRKRQAPAWFRTLFPGMFWLSAVGFSLIHLLNYTEGSLAVLLPLVVPQLILGIVLGYSRVHYGLWTAIAIHAAHNGFAISLAAIAMQTGAG